MKILLIGGSGYVGKMIAPVLKQHHQLRVFDLVPPADNTLEFIPGEVNDESALARAMEGVDGVVYLAMGKDDKGNIDTVGPAYDVNAKGVHRACNAALRAGAKRLVYMSTLSVYGGPGDRVFKTEDEEPASPGVYGFTKYLGELVCRYFSRAHGLDTMALRLNWPVENDKWQEANQRNPGCGATAADDVARAVLAALECRHSGFHAVFITGDYEGRKFNPDKARRLLGWEARRRA